MRFLAWLPLWLRAVLRRGAVEREMAREIRFHIDREMELNLERGMEPTEARRQALVAFGGVERAKEAVRDQRHTIWLEQAIADARFALRSLRRRPVFAILAMATIALAIGATTSIFTIVDNVLFRAIPTAGTGPLVAVWETIPAWRSQPVLASSWDHVVMDYPDFRNWRAHQSAFVAVGAVAGGGATLWSDGHPEQIALTRASPSLFTVLGTAPVLGRLFLPGEDVLGGPKVAVISYDTWQSRFGARPTVIGTGVLLDSVRYDIVGVLPKDFAISRGQRPRPFYVPAGQSPDDDNRDNHSFRVLARLKPGVTIERAATEAKQLLGSETANPTRGLQILDYQADQARTVRTPLLLLLGASMTLLLIATLNIATLLLGEGASREHEMSARIALGASRGRLVRQMLVESLLLAVLGAALGTALAWWMIKALIALAPANVPGIQLAHIDARVFGATICIAVSAGLLFGIAPALALSTVAPSDVLRGGRNLTPRRYRLPNILMTLQVALSVVLLLSAALVSRSLRALSEVQLGFRPEHIAIVRTSYPFTSFKTEADRAARTSAIAARLSAMPGIHAVSGASALPLDGNSATSDLILPGDKALGDRAPKREANRRIVLPNYFSTLSITLLAGRSFDASDRAETSPVIVVSEVLARREWPTESAVGKQLLYQNRTWTVIGVVADTKIDRLTDESQPTFYMSAGQYYADVQLLVKVEGDPAATAPAIRAAVAQASPLSQVSAILTMTDLVRASSAEARFRTTLIDLFGIMAIVLASIGLYGLTARMVARRVREAGIRIALGATTAMVSRLMVRRSMGLAGGGILLGLVLAVPATRLLTPYLFAVGNTDFVSYATTILVLGCAALVASGLPAARLRRLSPVSVLRSD